MTTLSSFTLGTPQEDGRWWVYEVHRIDNQSFSYEYLSDGSLNPQMVLEERFNVISNTLAERSAARVAVISTHVPLTRFEFLERFTTNERVSIREEAKNNPIVEDFMEMMKMSGSVSVILAMPALNYLVSIGKLTPERVVVIGGN